MPVLATTLSIYYDTGKNGMSIGVVSRPPTLSEAVIEAQLLISYAQIPVALNFTQKKFCIRKLYCLG